MAVEQGQIIDEGQRIIPRIVYDLDKVAKFCGVSDPALLTSEQESWGITILGPDAGMVIWEDNGVGQ